MMEFRYIAIVVELGGGEAGVIFGEHAANVGAGQMDLQHMLKKRITVIFASMGTTRTKLVPHHVTTSVLLEHIRQDMPLE